MRSLLKIVRVLGVLSVAFVLFAWMMPETVRKWLPRQDTQRQALAAARPQGTPAQAMTPPEPAVAVAQAASAPPASAASSAQAAGRAPRENAATAAPAETVALPAAAAVAKPLRISAAQAAQARWIGARYHVVPAAVAPLIVEADALSKSYRLSPNLLIAVMAIESNFHPYIQSEAGAQGLMQVMPRIHAKRYEKFGGKTAFLDPVVSLRVGAEVLRDSIKLKNGSETEGLRFYFGGGPASDGYIGKVRAEQHRLDLAGAGAKVPTS